MPRLFERFHRVKDARGRSYEGSGIGLALVQELVKLHGGTCASRAKSTAAAASPSRFRSASAHLPADRIEAARTLASTGLRRGSLRGGGLCGGCPDGPTPAAVGRAVGSHARRQLTEQTCSRRRPRETHRILLADDNADMREYVRRLARAERLRRRGRRRWPGRSPAAQRRKPDLVLTDVMMPELDGFGLLRELRADPKLGHVPIILLSARAGEEARIEGMHAGADDYLIKPFSARELLARVEAHLKMAQLSPRGDGGACATRTAQFETLLNQAPLGVYLVDAGFPHSRGQPDRAGRSSATFPAASSAATSARSSTSSGKRTTRTRSSRIFRHTLETGEPYITSERAEIRADRGVTEYYEWRLDRILLPDGRFGVVCYFRDICRRSACGNTQQLLLNELHHRIKNTLANVQAIVQQTLRRTSDPADFAVRFSGPLQSLARAHSMLTEFNLAGRRLRELIRDQLLQGRWTTSG